MLFLIPLSLQHISETNVLFVCLFILICIDCQFLFTFGFCDNGVPLYGGWVSPLGMGFFIISCLADVLNSMFYLYPSNRTFIVKNLIVTK